MVYLVMEKSEKLLKCGGCGETRESEFYPSYIKSSRNRCKSCVRKDNKLWKEKNPEKAKGHARKYMRNHPEVNRKNFRRWYKNNVGKQYERTLAYAQLDPQRHRAQSYAWKTFPEAQICETEGCFELGERHHDDYCNPYEIRWLCRKHHKELHKWRERV